MSPAKGAADGKTPTTTMEPAKPKAWDVVGRKGEADAIDNLPFPTEIAEHYAEPLPVE